MSQLDTDPSSYLEALRDRAREAIDRGRIGTAIELAEEAIVRARKHGDRDVLDLAVCNHAGVLITCEKAEGVTTKLREILLGSADPTNCFLAAFYLSRAHELRRQNGRGIFYARLALGHAERTGRKDFIIAAHNEIGNLQLVDCRFEEACESYGHALRLSGPEPSVDRALILSNIGYCEIVLDRHRRGFQHLFRSLRLLRRLGARGWEMSPRLGLSYAYLEIRKLDRAREHAARALEVAEAADRREHILNSLYLLGEAEKLLGNELAAYEHFNRLQREFHPDKPFVADFLMATDIRQLINLMA